MRWSIRSARKPHTGVAIRIQPSSPLAWNVPTIGPSYERERGDARRRRHRLVQVEHVELLALERLRGSGRSSAG